MKNLTISLNGRWDIEYLSEECYISKEEPIMTNEKISVANAIPNYFEDMQEEFEKSAFGKKIAINPLYEKQAYPMTSYAPDMALPNPVGTFVYRRTVALDSVSGVARLEFGGVQNRVAVWINGIYVDTHEGYSASFKIDIPSDALKAGKNTVTLAVSNTRLEGYMSRPVSGLTSRAANECTGGIYGDVSLKFYKNGLYDAWVSTSKDLGTFTVNLVANPDRERTLTILDGENAVTCVTISKGEASYTFSTADYELWSPSSPKLYTVRISDNDGNVFERRFGIRRLTANGTKLSFNGTPYFFKGICEHCYHPITVHPTRDKEYYRHVIKTAKSLGFNSIRFHTYVPQIEYLEAADEEGIAIEVETPNNTTYAEWQEIVKMTRRYTSVIAYSSGNEMVIDEDYIEHLRSVANFVHGESDALFSPMSAMRGVEYHSYGDCRVDTPFPHNPKRLAALSEFCDVYNTYSLGLTSYTSVEGNKDTLNERNEVYKKPLLSHEICINGTYCDLSLKERYNGSRIGKTEIFTSVERHLDDVGLLDRNVLYYHNSVKWQMLLRKKCFELMRRTESFAGYDFLGDIDTHWHTFGYCVGMMNEFYELKPGECAKNVLRYNGDTVLLADLPDSVNLLAKSEIEIPVLVSNYGEKIDSATLRVELKTQHGVILDKEIEVKDIAVGALTELYRIALTLPDFKSPERIVLRVTLGEDVENEWELFAYPKADPVSEKCDNLCITSKISPEELCSRLSNGESVVLLGASPFPYEPTTFQISLAGRTNGHLATVVREHELTKNLVYTDFLGEQFKKLLNGGRAAILDTKEIPFEPIIEIATSYKNAHREALLFEYSVGEGKLLVCTMNLDANDVCADWLQNKIITYAKSDRFNPKTKITLATLQKMLGAKINYSEKNTNEAINKNDITAN